MGKKKVYELAKELNVENKEIISIAQKLGIKVTSHLSGIDDAGVEKIKENMSKIKNNEKKVNEKEKKQKDEKLNSNVKTTGQVIIRREVIVEDDNKDSFKKQNKSDIGFANKKTNRDFNIVYREKPTKPMTVSELFGIKPKNSKAQSQEKKNTDNLSNNNENKIKESISEKNKVEEKSKVEEKTSTINENVETKNLNNKEMVSKPTEKSENNFKTKNEENRQEENNKAKFTNNNSEAKNNFYNNRYNNNFKDKNTNLKNRNFNNNNFKNNFNSNNGNNMKSRYGNNNNSNGYNSNYTGNNNRFNQRNGNFKNNANNNNTTNTFNKKFNQKSINIDNFSEDSFIEKENQRDYSTKIIDKQKANRNFDEKRKVNRSRRINDEEIDEDKLRDLKQVNKLSNMFENQDDGSMLDYYDLSTRDKRGKKKAKKEPRVKQKIFELKEITIPSTISVKDLATELKKTAAEVLKQLINLGIMANLNQELDFDTAYLVADSFGVKAIQKEEIKDEDILFDDSEDKEEDLKPRPPVVVVMGHVDHGKTSLLDCIRKTNVIEGEAGGITQHIGAYMVNVNGREITFLDTPGHEAFTSMRARGAQITDIAILVVAADDGVMPQTIEAINHAKAAGIPIIVAINKIDLPGANIEKIKQDLMKYDLVPEEWGGDTIMVPISAKKNINIDNLLEMVLLEADILNLRANPNRQSKGTVIEAKLDKTKGPVASVLVQRGTLNVGDTIIVGSSIGKIRTMKNDKGKNIKLATPSTPVEITGLKDVPEAGDIFYEVKNEKVAKHLIEQRKLEQREKEISRNDVVTLDNLYEKMENEDLKQFNVIVKTDVQGTAEALKSSLEKLSTDEIKVKVLHSNAGGVTESDVELAKASNAMILAFNVRAIGNAKKLAEKENVEIKQYSVIYEALEDVKNAMKGLLEPKYKEVNIGNAEIRQTFKVSNVGTIAGCYVTDGKVERNAGVRVIREGVVIHEGKLLSLKRFKDDAKEVSKGFECGIQIENFNDIKEGDIIEAYTKEEIKR